MKNIPKINQLLKPFNIQIISSQTVICIDEEYGYKHWILICNLNDNQLIQWWRKQWNIDKCFGKYVSQLPGKLILIKKYNNRNQNWDNIDHEHPLFLNKNWLYDNYYFDYYYTAWEKLKNSKLCYYSHLFTNEDSFLRNPNKVYIRHNGYWPSKLQLEKDIKEQMNDINN